KAEVLHAQGVFITRDENRSTDDVQLADREQNLRLIAEAAEVAKTADVIILAIGDTEQTSREGYARNHLGDRTRIDIVGEQNELFDAMKATGKPVVVVALNGRPPSWPNVVAGANAMLECWYLGQEGGTAMADALFGDINPGGKLPVTVVREEGQIPFFYNHKPSARRGYLFADISPLFPFGFGLSYTTFEMSAPRLLAQRIGVAGSVTVEVDVTNTGQRAGDEVVQVYVHDQVASVTRPIKELKAFRRVTLQPGETKTLSFTLGPEAFRLWDIDMNEVVEPGLFDILVGPNSEDLKSATREIAGGRPNGQDRLRPRHRHPSRAGLRHAQRRDRRRAERGRRRDAQRPRAGGGELPRRSRDPVPDRARPGADRGYLAVPLPRRLLASRPGDEERDRRGRHGAVGHQGQGRRPARLPAARWRLPRRLHGLWPRERQGHRRDGRQRAALQGGRLQGDPPAVGRSGPRLDLRRVEGPLLLRTRRRRPADRERLVEREVPALGPAAVRGGTRGARVGRPPAARHPPPADADRGRPARQGPRAVSPLLARGRGPGREPGQLPADPPAHHHAARGR